MNQNVHKRIVEKELSGRASEDEVWQLALIANRFSEHPNIKRSRAAHQAGLAILEERIDTKDAQKRWWSVRLTAIPALSLMVIVAVFFAAQSSLPGELLYSTKTFSEETRIRISFSSSDKASQCSTYMKRRANELASLHPSKLDTTTVGTLTGAIAEEADEYKHFIDQTSDSSQKERLLTQRKRDASYVAQALASLPIDKLSAEGAKLIEATISNMREIAKN